MRNMKVIKKISTEQKKEFKHKRQQLLEFVYFVLMRGISFIYFKRIPFELNFCYTLI